jgi:hypothetical protein
VLGVAVGGAAAGVGCAAVVGGAVLAGAVVAAVAVTVADGAAEEVRTPAVGPDPAPRVGAAAVLAGTGVLTGASLAPESGRTVKPVTRPAAMSACTLCAKDRVGVAGAASAMKPRW